MPTSTQPDAEKQAAEAQGSADNASAGVALTTLEIAMIQLADALAEAGVSLRRIPVADWKDWAALTNIATQRMTFGLGGRHIRCAGIEFYWRPEPATEQKPLLYEQLAEVTPAMVLAGVEAALQATTMIDDQGRRQFRSGVSTGTEYAAIWQAMLRAKLGLK